MDSLEFDKIQVLTENPELILAEAESFEKSRGQSLAAPYPDQFRYRKMIYEGFVKYPRRFSNYLVAKSKPVRTETVSYVPFLIDLEPNSRCNYRCTMCQVSQWPDGQRARDMTLDEFSSMESYFEYLVEVKLHGMGEPLLHRNFFEMLSILNQYKIWTRTSVNGSLLLARGNIERLLNSEIGEVQISIDGAKKETYEKIRVNGNFDKVCKGVLALNEASGSVGILLTRMWVVLQEENLKEIEEFVRLAISLKFCRLTFSLSLNDWGQQFWNEKNYLKQVDTNGVIERIKNLQELSRDNGLELSIWKQSGKYAVGSPDSICPWIFDRTFISSDMRLSPCAIIGNPAVLDVGSASDFFQEWNGLEYRKLRRSHLLGQVPACCASCYETSLFLNRGEQVFVDL